MCCGVLQRSRWGPYMSCILGALQCVAVCVAVCCSAVAEVLDLAYIMFVAVCCSVLQCFAVRCSAQSVAVRCSVLQCVAVCCSMRWWTNPLTIDLWLPLYIQEIRFRVCRKQRLHMQKIKHHMYSENKFTENKHYICRRKKTSRNQTAAVASGIHCKTLQHDATQCNTLQHTATHCNTMQHIAMQKRKIVAACASVGLRASGWHVWMSHVTHMNESRHMDV